MVFHSSVSCFSDWGSNWGTYLTISSVIFSLLTRLGSRYNMREVSISPAWQTPPISVSLISVSISLRKSNKSIRIVFLLFKFRSVAVLPPWVFMMMTL